MKKALYNRNWPHDNFLVNVAKSAQNAQDRKNDHFFLFIVGDTGTGKSSLTMWIYEHYDPEGCTIDQIALNMNDHADALLRAGTASKKRFCSYDEAHVSSRNAMTKYNKDLLELYDQIRGANIFHIWCNPTIDGIDKKIIQDVVKGVIVIVNKDEHRPRIYYYYDQKALHKMIDDGVSLKRSNLTKKATAQKYAYYKGWFRKYTGKMWKDYENLKDSKIEDKLVDHQKKHGTNKLKTVTDISKDLKIGQTTCSAHRDIMVNEGYMKEGDDFELSAVGKYFFTPKGEKKLHLYAKHKRKAYNMPEFPGNEAQEDPLNINTMRSNSETEAIGDE